MDFPKRIGELLEALGVNQTQLASKMGVSRGIVSEFASGARDPSKEFLFGLSKMGVSLDWFITGEGEMYSVPPDDSAGKIDPEYINQALLAPGGTIAPISGTSRPGTIPARNNQPEIMNLEDFLGPVRPMRFADITLFTFKHGQPQALETGEDDPNAMTLLPLFGQPAAAGPGQPPNQLAEVEAYMPILFEMLGGAHPRNCGMVRVVGDSMTDISLFSGDVAVFDRSQIEGDGVYVIGISGDIRIKRVEYRPIEKKIIVSSENIKRYPNPEVISYQDAADILQIFGKVICWVHKHPY